MNIDSSKIELKINCFREISKPGYCFLAEAYAVFIEPPSSHLQKQPPQVFCKKNVFLEILQNSQENAFARDFF